MQRVSVCGRAGDMLLMVGVCGRELACGRGLGHVAEGECMWQGAGHVASVGACSRGWGMWQRPEVKKSNTLTIDEVHKCFSLTK